MKKVTIGIIGCGRHSSVLFLAMSELLNLFDIKYLCDLDDSLFENFLDQLPYREKVKTTTDYLEVLQDREIEAVLILTPTYCHIQIAKDALKYQKDILMEKPIGLDLEDVDDFIIKALNSKQIVQLDLPYHYAYFFRHMRYMLSKERLGRTKHILIKEHRGPFVGDWFFDKSKSGGAINDKVIHFFDISNELFTPSRAVSVFAKGSQHYYHENMELDQITDTKMIIENPTIVDHAAVIVEYENGSILNVDLNMYQKTPIEGLEIDATTLKGKSFEVEIKGSNFNLIYDQKDHRLINRKDNDSNGINHPGVLELLKEFYKSVTLRTQPSANLWLAREAQVIAFAAEESIVHGHPINLLNYRNKKIDRLAKSLGLDILPTATRHQVAFKDKVENHDLIDDTYQFIRRLFPKKNLSSYKKVNKNIVQKVLEDIRRDNSILSSIRDINESFQLSLPWVEFVIEFRNGDINILDSITLDIPAIKCNITEKAYFAILKGESIVGCYLSGDIKLEGNFNELQKDRAGLIALLDALRKACAE